MATWKFEQFEKYIQSEISSSYLFYGEETYLADLCIQKIKNRIFENSIADFNYDIFYGSEIEMDRLQETIETLPMMSEKRLVLIKEAHNLKTSDLEKLSEMLSIPIETTCLVLIFESIDQRKKIFKDLFKKMIAVEIGYVQDKQIPLWIHRISEHHNKKVSPQAAKTLYELIGNSLIDLSNELGKLSLYVGDRKTIEEKDVEAIVSKYKLDSVFELTDAVGNKNFEKAYELHKYLLDQGENEVGVLSMITRHIRILLHIIEAQSEGVPSSSIASYAGVPPFFASNYISQARKWKYDSLRQAYLKLQETDKLLKTANIAKKNFLFDSIRSLTLA